MAERRRTTPGSGSSPRPALRKAPDASVHPAAPDSPTTPGAQAQASAPAASRAARPGGLRHAGTSGSPSASPSASPAARGGADPGQRRMVRVGSATSDVLRGKAGDKLVEITVRLPKSLRKQLKAEAKARGTTVDDLVAHCLAQKLLR